MSTIIEAPKSNFKPHPEGTFLATMCDCWLETKPNPFKGQARDKKDPSKGVDTRETITEILLAFLTEEMVEVDGKMKPGYVRYRASASVAENSNLRKFLKGWFPKLQDSDFERFDADKLIGRGAYISVAHNVSKSNGNTYANVVNAAQPPKGSTPPELPHDFLRKHEREAQAAAQQQTQQAPIAPIQAEDEDDLTF